MFEEQIGSEELREQLAGALGSQPNFQNGWTQGNKEGWTPVSLEAYEGYSELVDDLPPPAVLARTDIADPQIQPLGGGSGDIPQTDPVPDEAPVTVLVPPALARAIQTLTPLDRDEEAQAAVEELVEAVEEDEPDPEVPVTPDSPDTPPGPPIDPPGPPIDPPGPPIDPPGPPTPPEETAEINIVKSLYSINDDVNDTEINAVGDELIYQFAVSNPGDVDLDNINVSDDTFDTYIGSLTITRVSGDDGDNILENGETWIYRSDSIEITQDILDDGNITSNDEVNNTAEVTGDPVGGGTAVTDDDDATVPVALAEINIVKSLYSINDDVNDTEINAVGDELIYQFAVSNPGDVDLDNINVSDDTFDTYIGSLTITRVSGDDGDNILENGETWIYRSDSIEITQDILDDGNITSNDEVNNTAEVTGDPVGGGTAVTDDDDATVPVALAEINIVKSLYSINGDVNDTEINAVGDELIYQFAVSNPGDVDLDNINVSDDTFDTYIGSLTITRVSGDDGDNILENGETWIYRSDSIEITQDILDDGNITSNDEVNNTAEVTGDPVGGGTAVTDDDDATVPVDIPDPGTPSINIVKSLYSINDDVNDTEINAVGDELIYQFAVSNPGDVDLDNINVSDDTFDTYIGSLTITRVSGDDGDNILENGETWIYRSDSIEITQDILDDGNITSNDEVNNTAEVTGDPVGGGTAVTDDDDATVPVALAEINIVKSLYSINDDVNDTEINAVGDELIYQFAVSNPGDVDLDNINVSDDTFDTYIGSLTITRVSGDDGDNILENGETWIYRSDSIEITQDILDDGNITSNDEVNNTAEVTGDPVGGGTAVTDDDDATVPVALAEINIVKSLYSINGDVNDTEINAVGDELIYQFAVSNPGDVDLDNINVSDDTFDTYIGSLTITRVSGDDGDNILENGETWIYRSDSIEITQDILDDGNITSNDEVNNTAEVTGDPVGGGTAVTDDDDATVPVNIATVYPKDISHVGYLILTTDNNLETVKIDGSQYPDDPDTSQDVVDYGQSLLDGDSTYQYVVGIAVKYGSSQSTDGVEGYFFLDADPIINSGSGNTEDLEDYWDQNGWTYNNSGNLTDGAVDNITDLPDGLQTAYTSGDAIITSATTPIVIDLLGNGINYIGLEDGVSIEFDNLSGSYQTAWAEADDAILVIDEDGSGSVNNTREYIFTEWNPGAKTDMQAVREVFDTDNDALLSSSDDQWNDFALWVDANSDGVSDAGELISLDDAGVVSIGLTYIDESQPYVAADGDVLVFGQSEVFFSDGSTTVADDAAFAVTPIATDETSEPVVVSDDGSADTEQAASDSSTGSPDDLEADSAEPSVADMVETMLNEYPIESETVAQAQQEIADLETDSTDIDPLLATTDPESSDLAELDGEETDYDVDYEITEPSAYEMTDTSSDLPVDDYSVAG